jgi:cytoskeletal protein CcmA (bactofilin family)
MARKETDKQATPTNPKPDFENNLAAFETAFFEFAAYTDPNFDVNSLRHNPLAPISILNTTQSPELMHPTTKYELRLPIRLATPQTVNSDIVGNKITLEGSVRVKGNVFGFEEVFIGPNCVIEGNVVSSQKVRIEEGSNITGAVTGQVIELSGSIVVGGPIVSRSDITVTGSLEAPSLHASGNIFLIGASGDEVKLSASYILAANGDIEAAVPVFLGTGKAASFDTQKFYFSQSNGSFRLVRARHTGIDANRPAEQNTILTALTDSDLEKLLTELAVLEQRNGNDRNE